MNNELKCPICGKPTYLVYGNPRKDGLCQTHGQEFYHKKIEQCPNCKKWKKTNEECECKKKTVEKNTSTANELTCLICEKPSNGKHFCFNCWKKYSERTITVNIIGCKSAQIVDEYGNRTYKTQNGMFVRSQQEKIIYDELYSRRIKVIYEASVFYKDENGETKELHPDFYLPDYNLYIEHWGYENSKNPDYIKTKKFKEEIYKTQGKKIAGTTGEDIKDIKTAIDKIFFENDIRIE